MSKQDIGYLMDDSRRDLASARRFRDEGTYPKSINDSYYASFYAAKAYLLHLNIPSKSHKSVQQRIAAVVGEGRLPPDMRGILRRLLERRNEAAYNYARRDWTEQQATEALHLAENFVDTVDELISS